MVYTCALLVMCVDSQVGMVYMYTCSNICPLASENGIYTCALVAIIIGPLARGNGFMCTSSNVCPLAGGNGYVRQ